MFIDTKTFRCYYTLVRLCTGGVRVPLNELASANRIAGMNSVLRKLKTDCLSKIFLSKEADPVLLKEIVSEAQERGVSIEWAEDSLQLGRACAVSRKTAAAAILKK